MLKNIYALIALMCVACFLCPINLIKNQVVVSKGGKSAGEFFTADKTEISKFINLDGISCNIKELEVTKLIRLTNAKKVHSFYDGEILNVYYYSNKIGVKEVVQHKRVNVHVAIKNEEITVGIPLIYYGY